MAKTAKDVIRDALELPANERERVIDELVDMFGVPGGSDEDRKRYEEEWSAEIQRRIERLESGEDKGMSWDTVVAEIKAHLASIRKSA